jgi:prephenate dehydratase
MRVAIQGEAGSFHDEVAHKWFGPSVQIVPAKSFAEVFEALKNNQAEYAVVAISNSTFGPIKESTDLVAASPYRQIGKVDLRIAQQLIGLPGAKLSDIKTVYSHPVALPQCSDFLTHTLPNAELIPYHDTAASVGLIQHIGDKTCAAIAGRQAAALYNFPILAEDIENDKANTTSFVVLSAV